MDDRLTLGVDIGEHSVLIARWDRQVIQGMHEESHLKHVGYHEYRCIIEVSRIRVLKQTGAE